MKSIAILRHVDYERLGWIPDLLNELHLPFRSISLSLGDDFPALSGISGVISMGGPMSAYERDSYPFLQSEMDFLKELVQEEVPFLGICLGGQILAQAFGAKVRKGVRELGWLPLYPLEGFQDDPVFSGLNTPLMFQYHHDVFELPDGAAPLLKSDIWENQAFRLGRNAYGIQFHPETTPEMLRSVFQEYQDKLTPDEIDLIREDMEARSEKGREFLKEILMRLFV